MSLEIPTGEWTPCDRCNDVAVRKHKCRAGQMISRYRFTCADCLAQQSHMSGVPTSDPGTCSYCDQPTADCLAQQSHMSGVPGSDPGPRVPDPTSETFPHGFVPFSASDNRRRRLVAALQAAGIE